MELHEKIRKIIDFVKEDKDFTSKYDPEKEETWYHWLVDFIDHLKNNHNIELFFTKPRNHWHCTAINVKESNYNDILSHGTDVYSSKEDLMIDTMIKFIHNQKLEKYISMYDDAIRFNVSQYQNMLREEVNSDVSDNYVVGMDAPSSDTPGTSGRSITVRTRARSNRPSVSDVQLLDLGEVHNTQNTEDEDDAVQMMRELSNLEFINVDGTTQIAQNVRITDDLIDPNNYTPF